LLDEEDVKGGGGTSADEMNFHRQDGIVSDSPPDLLSTFSL